MTETPADRDRADDRPDDDADPRVEKAVEVKRQREADTAASRPAGGADAPTGAPAPQ